MRLAILSVILVSVLFAANDDIITQKKKELETINKQMEQQRINLSQTEKKAQTIQNSIKIIESDLDKQNKNQKKVNGQISQTKVEITGMQLEIQKEKVKFDEALGSLSKKFDQYYRLGNTNFIEDLFNVEELPEYLNDMYFFETMITTNVNFLKDIRERKERLMTKQTKLNVKLDFLKEKEEYIAGLKTQIQKNKDKHEILYNDLMVQKKEYEKRIHQLEQDSQELGKLITKMQRQSQNQSRIGDGRFIWPVLGEITSDFGERVHPIFKVKSFHTGIDIGSPTGRPVFAVDDGVVMFSGNWGGYGKTIIIDHGVMTTTLYAHLSQYFVKKSVTVKKGQIIGLVGSTGLSTGSHLHFEVRIDGKEKNPINYLPKK